MKKSKRYLMFMISTEGKSMKQIEQEDWVAFQKFQKVAEQVESQVKNKSKVILSRENN